MSTITGWENTQIRNGEVLKSLRSMCAREIQSAFSYPESVSNVKITGNGKGIVSILDKRGRTTELEWKEYNGDRKLCSTNGKDFSKEDVSVKKKKEKKEHDYTEKNVYLDFDAELNKFFEVGYGFGIGDVMKWRTDISFNHTLGSLGLWGVHLQVEKDEYKIFKEFNESLERGENKDLEFVFGYGDDEDLCWVCQLQLLTLTAK